MVKAKLNTLFSVMFFVVIMSLSGCAAEVDTKSPVKLVEGFVIAEDINLARSEIEASGGKINHIFFEDKVLIGKIPYNFKNFKVYYSGDESPEGLENIYSVWEKNLEWKNLPISERVFDDSLEPIMNDVVSFEDDPFARDFSKKEYNAEKSLPQGALATDTSLYMIGDVSVSVILPESVGGSEDWTVDEIAEVHAEIMNGLDWWSFNNPDADLTFVYDWNDQVSVVDEPIESNHIDYWIVQSMESLGYPFTGAYMDSIYDFVNDQKSLKNTDWGFAVFVVDSSNDEDGKFADDYFAFAVMNGDGGGPYLVMTYDTEYGINNMDAVLAHEVGHIFGAADQYGSCSCSDDVGYLNYQNQNCINGCSLTEDSIMKSITSPFANNLIDEYAKGQIGWVDSDGDGILDIVDFEPNVTSFFTGIQSSSYFSIMGDVFSDVYPSPNSYYSDVSINKISNVEYNLNNGSWINSSAIDGLFDEFSERHLTTKTNCDHHLVLYCYFNSMEYLFLF